MPKRICGADLGAKVRWAGIVFRSRNLRAVAFNMRCKAPAIKTARGSWRCPLHGGLSTGPKTVEGKARIGAAARARWEVCRATKRGRANTETIVGPTGRS